MIHFLLILTAALACYLAYRLFLLRRSIARTEEELRQITSASGENRILKLAAPDKNMERLLKTINGGLETMRAERLEYQRHEQRLKEQVENISHDLRTPLTAVLGYLKMIDQESLTPEDQEYLEIVGRKAHTLQSLVAQFYELTRVTSEEFKLELSEVNITRVLKETCLENYELIEQEQLQFDMDILDAPVTIQGDTQALERIFLNLLQNSIRYAKSELHIRLSCMEGSDAVKLVFENDIEPELELDDPGQMFERFYIQEQSRTRGGSGLGLTISRCLAEAMNGTIEASYCGSEKRMLAFTLEFPLC